MNYFSIKITIRREKTNFYSTKNESKYFTRSMTVPETIQTIYVETKNDDKIIAVSM